MMADKLNFVLDIIAIVRVNWMGLLQNYAISWET